MDQTSAVAVPARRARVDTHPALDWVVALGSLWLVSGLHLDGWAHRHIQLESFFTPWHAVLYSGYAITAAAVGLAFLNGIRSGRNWRTALPGAYRPSLIGAIIFLAGGLADLTWHTLFGIEANLEALLSPPHLVLALGGGLLVTGPLRAALYQAGTAKRHLAGERPAPGLPALLSLAALLALLAFFSEYANPWFELTDRGSNLFAFHVETFSSVQLVTAVLLHTALLMGGVLLFVRRFRLPFGSLTLLFSLLTALAAAAHTNWGLVPIAALGGLAADGLALALRPRERDWGTRLFAFLSPVVLYALYFAAMVRFGNLDWSMELWGGTILMAGLVGWLLSYGFIPVDLEGEEPDSR